MPEVCTAFQSLTNWVVGGKVFACVPPEKPLEAGMATEASHKYTTEMRWRNVSWPTESQEACIAQGTRMLDLREVKAGEKITADGFKCVDRESDKVTVDFSVTRECAAGKDPQAPGSCTSTATIKKPASSKPAAN